MFPDPTNNNPFYLVLEIQEGHDGTRGCIPWFFDEYDDAVAKYGQIFAAAAQSGLPYHACLIMNNKGYIQTGDCRVWDRRGIGNG